MPLMPNLTLTVAVALSFVLASAVLFPFPWSIFVVAVIILTTLPPYILVEFLWTKEPTFSYKKAWKRYLTWKICYIKGMSVTKALQADTKEIRNCQERELLKLLRLNSETEYSKKMQLGTVETREEFVQRHPLSQYDQFQEYFDRMVKGEEKVITSQKAGYYPVTSGTTGKGKIIPFVRYQYDNMIRAKCSLTYVVSNERCGIRDLNRTLKFYYNVRSALEKSADGIEIGPISASSQIYSFKDDFTTPEAGYNIADETSTRYVHLLFGLRHRDLRKIETVFVTLVYTAFADLETNWKDLVNDIRAGTLKPDLKIPENIRVQLVKKLAPDDARADELEAEFLKGFKNIAKRIWPKLEVIECVASGSFSHYADELRTHYTADVLIYSHVFGASEGLIGLNIWPSRLPQNFLIWPYAVFYEFIPLADVTETAPKTIFLDQVVRGEAYEVVMTTSSGLYRYRLGDVIRVVDFYNQCAVIEFLYRTGSLLNVKGEKMSEICLLNNLKKVMANISPRADGIVDFTCVESVSADSLDLVGAPEKSSVPYYLIFLELKSADGKNLSALQKELGEKWDAAVVKDHPEYGHYRNKDGITPLQVYLVKPGGFARLRNFMLDNSKAAPVQIKLPKLLRNPEWIKFMWTQRSVVES